MQYLQNQAILQTPNNGRHEAHNQPWKARKIQRHVPCFISSAGGRASNDCCPPLENHGG